MHRFSSRAGVVVPVRAFTLGKLRLATHLDEASRRELARDWATTVVRAAAPMPVVVVTSDPEVVTWAAAQGAHVVDDPGTLDGAAEAGRVALAALGCTRVVVAHGDLPLARSFDPVLADVPDDAIAIVPCHRDDGTTVLSIPAASPFPFAYGPGSFARHVAAAQAQGREVRVVRDADLAFDVDVPSDLERLNAITAARPVE